MSESPVQPADLLDYRQAAELLGTAPAFVERLVAQRRLPYFKIGHFVRIRRDDLNSYVAQTRIPAAGE